MSFGPWGCFYDGHLPTIGNGDDAPNIGFYAWRSSNQAIPSGVETIINFTSKKDENPSGIFNLTTDTFTAPQEGRYVFSSGVEATLAWQGSLFLRFYLNNIYNGSDSDETSVAATVTPNYSLVTWMDEGDTAQMRVFQNSGFAASLIGCCNQIWFSGAAMFVV